MASNSSAPNTSTISAEMHVIADLVERQTERVASLAAPFAGTDRDDIVVTVHEAERQLLMASRALRRAIKSIERSV